MQNVTPRRPDITENEGSVKVNTDGSAKGAPVVSTCGGIFRNARGFVCGLFQHLSWLWLESHSSLVISLLSSNSLKIPWGMRNDWSRALTLSKRKDYRFGYVPLPHVLSLTLSLTHKRCARCPSRIAVSGHPPSPHAGDQNGCPSKCPIYRSLVTALAADRRKSSSKPDFGAILPPNCQRVSPSSSSP
ncbi:hypothetical protein TIFTF001_047630 [Ficus carica]|uniref:RNase H type-1 domain-containing protein n=1 Tax=Ficus carica TaxID=3494 RepID=A0AA88D1K5_FICCA|nr:hypothetical protein TIFTF001_047630 [Ficus carica]